MNAIEQIFFPTFALAFSLLHFLLYYYNRNNKSTLYFSLFLFFFALSTYLDWYNLITPNMFCLRLHRFFLPISQVFILLFAYAIYNFKRPPWFRLIIAGFIIMTTVAVINPVYNYNFLQIIIIINMVEIARIFHKAQVLKKQGSKIIATGFAFLLIFSAYDILLDFNLIKPFHNISNGYPFGFVLMIIFMSIYLARDYAYKYRIMIEEERKSRELDEARALQQAMLPSSCELGGMDNCFYIRPATEIGGDYYDYHNQADGSLTIAIGDATGHGLKAGIMVAIIKSLFLTNKELPFDQFFQTCTDTLRAMRLGNLYMAMLLVRIKDNLLTASAAGMPFITIYRAADKSLEELELKGMPLGATESYPYKTLETRLEKDDVVLLMSDGLIELFNPEKQTFGEERVKSLFRTHAHLPAPQIIEKLVNAADNWRAGAAQNDDITLIVFKK